VSQQESVRQMIEGVRQRHGRLDILVNNASVRHRRALGDVTLAEWREVLGITLDGAFFCAQAAAPHLVRGGVGRIINIGGDSAFTGATDHAHVIAAKAGLQGLTRALAADLAPQQVTGTGLAWLIEARTTPSARPSAGSTTLSIASRSAVRARRPTLRRWLRRWQVTASATSPARRCT
jgi:NAD(P)-dependent dehydrogenase (short-subunit alcohol dehydrogenase family)